MPIPNGGLITETNQQYYEGAQGFVSQTGAAGEFFNTTFNTDLVFSTFDPNNVNYALNNFKLYTSPTGLPQTYTEYLLAYTVVGNRITFTNSIPAGTRIVVQLKILTGGHAKRGLQEFSYDTLKSIHSQELTIPASLSVVIPQDYVNYVAVSWIDNMGVKRPIYPANNLTISPFQTPIQDQAGVPTNDNFGDNIEGTSITEERWKKANDNLINGQLVNNIDEAVDFQNAYGFEGSWNWGRQYGLDPQTSQTNGWFNMNEREGKMAFSSNLNGKLIVLEYISDGLAYDLDTRVPKMAEEAMYAYLSYSVLSTRINQPEYVIQRLKKEKTAKLRNAKIRLSNIKLEEIVQVMRGKSKWIKH